MKQSILYLVVAAAIAAAAIVGCNGDFGNSSEDMNGFLQRFHERVVPKYTITYDGNGHTGGTVPKDNYSPYDSGTVIKTLNHGSLEKNGFLFSRWDTRADGKGESKGEGDELRLVKNDTLYAQWEDEGNFLNTVTVATSPITGTGASGSGRWPVGRVITINAGSASGWQFQMWTVTKGGVTLDSANSATTTFKMPNNDVTVTAMFIAIATAGETSSFTDSRDGKTYRSVKIGDQIWTAQNMNYETDNSWCYDNKPDNCNTYGRLYNWEAARTVCLNGWHLPDTAELNRLVAAAGGASPSKTGGGAGNALISTSGWGGYNGTDDYGFSALPGGFRYSGGSFYDAGIHGYWWTATERSGDGAYGWSMDYKYVKVDDSDENKFNGFSVRCLKND